MSEEEPIRLSSQNFLLNKNALIQLQNNDPALKCLTVGIDLDVYDMSKTDGFLPHESDWGKLGRLIGRNTHITELRFGQTSGTSYDSETREGGDDIIWRDGKMMLKPTVRPPCPTTFEEFCSGLANNTSVKKVDFVETPRMLGECHETGFGFAYYLMSDWFKNDVIEDISMPVCTLDEANYDNSNEIGKMAIVLARFSSLKRFSIEFDGGVYPNVETCEVSAEIITALTCHTDLKHLWLSHTYNSWSREGYAALAGFLSDSKVKKLRLPGGNMSDEGIIAVTNALGENDTLEEIFIDDNCITSTGWKAFAKLLSNPASIMDTYNSNHIIQKLMDIPSSYSEDEEWKMRREKDQHLHLLLRVNTLCNKSDAARVKIILRHLTEDFSMEPFASMNVVTMPYALAWMGKRNPDIASLYPFADADLCLMYKFVRGVAPVLFEASPLVGSKRKLSEPE